MIQAYTDITFTDKQKEDSAKLFDLLVSSGFKDEVFKLIPDSEIDYIYSGVFDSINEIYKYRNSALGIADALVQEYKEQGLNAEKIQEEISNPENLSLLKGVLTKLG